MSEDISFSAIVHSVKFDNEGEGTVVLKTPLSDLIRVVVLLGSLEQELSVNIKQKGR